MIYMIPDQYKNCLQYYLDLHANHTLKNFLCSIQSGCIPPISKLDKIFDRDSALELFEQMLPVGFVIDRSPNQINRLNHTMGSINCIYHHTIREFLEDKYSILNYDFVSYFFDEKDGFIWCNYDYDDSVIAIKNPIRKMTNWHFKSVKKVSAIDKFTSCLYGDYEKITDHRKFDFDDISLMIKNDDIMTNYSIMKLKLI